MRKWLAKLTGAEQRKAIQTLKQKVADQERRLNSLEHQLLVAAGWSSQVDLNFKKFTEALDAVGYYKQELEARDADNAMYAAALSRDNPGIIPP